MTKEQMAIGLIKKFESFKPETYPDSGNLPTIGYGSRTWPDGSKVQYGQKCTEEQASNMLNFHLIKFVYPYVNKLCKGVEVPDKVYAALCSFCYNAGAGWFTNDSFIVPVSRKDWGTFDPKTETGTGLSATFLRYNKITIDGALVFSRGLMNRRVAEVKFMLGIDDLGIKNVS